MVNLMESYRMGLEQYGIGVSVVCPANIKSNIAEASRLRPANFANSGYVENDESVASLHSIHQHGMEPDELAAHMMRGIIDNQLYIIPYPDARDGLQARFDQILEAVPPLESDPEGARLRTEALMNWASGRASVFIGEKD